MDPDQIAEQEFVANLRSALQTPPISNEEIERRSKAQRIKSP
jgi:hypothetical protein